MWDPRTAPPADAETVVVPVRELSTIQQTYQWLNSGQHPFRSVVIDSLTEAQKRAADEIAGTALMKTQDWGTLLRKMDALVRAFRDLKMHPANPLECIVFVCASRTDENGTVRPFLQGQMAITLPGFVDVVAHLGITIAEDGALRRVATFQPVPGVAAKDRTGRLGTQMYDPTIPALFAAVYGAHAQEGDAA